MEEMMRMYGISQPTPPDKKLILNSASPLISKLEGLCETDKELAEALASHIYKLALLSQKKFTAEEIEAALHCLDTGRYGMVLRAKGIVAGSDGSWIHFDYVPEEHDVRRGSAAVTGRLCVIGADISETALAQLFGV